MTTNRPLATVPLYQALRDRHGDRLTSLYLTAAPGHTASAKVLEALLAQVATAEGLEPPEDLSEVLVSVEYRYHQGRTNGRGEVRVMSHLGKPTIKVRSCKWTAHYLVQVIRRVATDQDLLLRIVP